MKNETPTNQPKAFMLYNIPQKIIATSTIYKINKGSILLKDHSPYCINIGFTLLA